MSEPPRPRLAISGSAGVGKSTLAQTLAARFGVPYLPEGMRTRLEQGLDLHSLSHQTFKTLIHDLIFELIDDAERHQESGFVADRSAIDGAAFWLYYGFAHDEALTTPVMARVRQSLDRYDLVIVLPWGVLPLVDDGIRLAQSWPQLHLQALIEGLTGRWIPAARRALMPHRHTALEARCAWIADRLAITRKL